MAEAFKGSKVLLRCDQSLAVLRRDDIPNIPWPGRIDLPGGAREGDEDPETCALRETREEIGLEIEPSRIIWSRRYEGPSLPSWVFALDITNEEAGSMQLGDEGQACWMMEIDAYLAADDAIPHQQDRVRDALKAIGISAGG